MKIFILGHGKSGTTVFLYKVAGGLPDCRAFSGSDPGRKLGDYQNAVYKHTYRERKGRSFEIYLNHVKEVDYDRLIWMARDPRDVAISQTLYRWHKGYWGRKKQYRAYQELIYKKEQDPASVPFHVICRYTGKDNWPRTTEEVLDTEKLRYQRMHDFVNNLGSEWFVFRYEDLIDKNFGALNEYLGFEIKDDAEIPLTTKKSKVARKKAYGDWRQWFTEEDVELYKPVYSPYMDLVGCDSNDWVLNPEAAIAPEFSSLYVKELIRKNRMDNIRNIKDKFKNLIKS
jgi:hypothetical protein